MRLSVSSSAPSHTTQPRGKLGWVLFACAFLIPGLAVIVLGPLDTLLLHWRSASWEQRPAQLHSVDLEVSRGDSTTYRVTATYRYNYNGVDFEGDRVSYDQSSDNIGSYHRDTERRLQALLRRGGQTQVWVNPADPQQSLLRRDLRWDKLAFSGLFGLIFAAVGLGLLAVGLARPALRQDSSGTVSIQCGQKASAWFLAFIGLVCLALSAPATLAIPSEIRKGNWLILLVLLFVLVGIWFCWLAWKAWRNWRFYGPMPYYPDPYPGQAGGHVAGYIHLTRPWPAEPAITVRLLCVRVRVTGSGKSRSTSETVLWQDDMLARTELVGTATQLRFQFEPPANLPASEPASRDYVVWRLLVDSPGINGVTLERSYELPVVQGVQHTAQPLPDDWLALQERQRNVQALTDMVTQIDWQQVGDHHQLISRAGRLLGFYLVLLIVGGFCSAGAVLLWQHAAREGFMLYVMAVVFGVLGIPMTIAAVFTLGRSLRVDIRGTDICAQRYWLGMPVWQTRASLTPTGKLSLTSAGSYTSGNRVTELFHLEYHAQGKRVRIAEGLRGREQAEALRDSLAPLLKAV